MNGIWVIAETSWKSILRLRVVYFLIFCVWALVASMWRYDEISMGRHREFMIDASLLLNQIAAVLVVLSICFEIPKELREGIASTYLTKSLGRTRYLCGKMVGAWVSGAVICLMIAIGSYFIYVHFFGSVSPTAGMEDYETPAQIFLPQVYAKVQILTILSIIPMAPIGVFFAVILPEMASPIVTLIAVWFATMTSQINIPLLSGGVIPNLNFYNLRDLAVYQTSIPNSYLFLAALWGLSFAVFLLMLTGIIFQYKDIK